MCGWPRRSEQRRHPSVGTSGVQQLCSDFTRGRRQLRTVTQSFLSRRVQSNGFYVLSFRDAFRDTHKVYVRGGTGGEGASTFKVMAKRQRGSPNGGSGGKGGDVTLVRIFSKRYPYGRLLHLCDSATRLVSMFCMAPFALRLRKMTSGIKRSP